MLGAISYDPLVKIEVGPLDLSPHGIGIAIGFLAGAVLMLRAAEKKGISEEAVYSLLIRALVGSIVGARLAYVLNHFSDFESPVEILQIWRGGISLLGGIIGGIAAPCLWARRNGVSFWKGTDAAAPGLALGIVIGRLGDLVVADHLGKPTSFFLGYLCPGASVETASPCPPGVVVHQTALYDLVLTALLLGLLLWLRRRDRFDGFLILTFGAVYGAQRLVEDFFREDLRRLGLTGSQWTAAVAVLLCLYVLLVTRRTPAWGRWDAAPAADSPTAPSDDKPAEDTAGATPTEETGADQIPAEETQPETTVAETVGDRADDNGAEPTMTDEDQTETSEELPDQDAAEAETGD